MDVCQIGNTCTKYKGCSGHRTIMLAGETWSEIEYFITIRCIKNILRVTFAEFFFQYFTVWKKSKCAKILSVCSFLLSPTKLKLSSNSDFLSQPILFIPSLSEYNLRNTPIPWARTNKVWLVLLDELFDQNKMFPN